MHVKYIKDSVILLTILAVEVIPILMLYFIFKKWHSNSICLNVQKFMARDNKLSQFESISLNLTLERVFLDRHLIIC